MIIPTEVEIKEFAQLHSEFKNYKNGTGKVEIEDEIIDLLVKDLHKDDPLRTESQRLKRHNKYEKMCTLMAPYFFEMMH